MIPSAHTARCKRLSTAFAAVGPTTGGEHLAFAAAAPVDLAPFGRRSEVVPLAVLVQTLVRVLQALCPSPLCGVAHRECLSESRCKVTIVGSESLVQGLLRPISRQP
jgi:hypothetical protein